MIARRLVPLPVQPWEVCDLTSWNVKHEVMLKENVLVFAYIYYAYVILSVHMIGGLDWFRLLVC